MPCLRKPAQPICNGAKRQNRKWNILTPRLGVYILLRVGIKAAEKYGHQCSRSESELLHCTAQESLGEIHLPDLQLQGRTRPYSLTSQWLNVQEINQTQP